MERSLGVLRHRFMRVWVAAVVLACIGGVAGSEVDDGCELTSQRPLALIPGAVKSGTTALHSALRDALGVEGNALKEVYYFNKEDAYARGPRFYGERLGCDDGPKIDGSPMYLAHPTALSRAALSAPWATWIVMIREPVDRTFSHYNMLARYGARARPEVASNGTFHDAVTVEMDCLDASLAASALSSPRAAAKYAWKACVAEAVAGPLGSLKAAGKLGLFGVTHGLVSQSLYAPQLEAAARNAPAPNTLLAVSQRALFDDGAATLGAILRHVRVDATVPHALRSYESLSEGRETMAVRDGATYAGHRARLHPDTLAALDRLFKRPNCALAQVLSDPTIVPVAIGFHADAAWLKDDCQPPRPPGPDL